MGMGRALTGRQGRLAMGGRSRASRGTAGNPLTRAGGIYRRRLDRPNGEDGELNPAVGGIGGLQAFDRLTRADAAGAQPVGRYAAADQRLADGLGAGAGQVEV